VNANYRFVSEFNKMKARASSLGRALSQQRATTRVQNTTLDMVHRALVVSEAAREEAMLTAREALEVAKKAFDAVNSMADNVRMLAERFR
jgi:hypothetical protein